MSVMIRHPRRPNEAGVSYVPDDGYAAALKDRLVKRGYEVVETVPPPAATISVIDPKSALGEI